MSNHDADRFSDYVVTVDNDEKTASILNPQSLFYEKVLKVETHMDLENGVTVYALYEDKTKVEVTKKVCEAMSNDFRHNNNYWWNNMEFLVQTLSDLYQSHSGPFSSNGFKNTNDIEHLSQKFSRSLDSKQETANQIVLDPL